MDIVAVAITLVAAMLLGVGFVLQQHAAEQAPTAYFLRLQLIADLLRRPRWLLGAGVMIAGQLLSAWSVGHLELSMYEPLLATSLIFALALAVPLSRQRLRATELVGAVILSGGVAALSLSRSPGTPSASFGSFSDWPAAAGIAVVAYCLIHAGHRRSGCTRATLTGIGTGLVFGISDALTRRTVQILDAHSVAGLLTSWPPYCLLATALTAWWLMQNSFNSGPLHASLPGITAAEPVSGILLGVVVFGDVIRISAGMLAVQAAGIAALVIGVIMVARAPVLSQLRPASAIRSHRSHGGGQHGPPNAADAADAAAAASAQDCAVEENLPPGTEQSPDAPPGPASPVTALSDAAMPDPVPPGPASRRATPGGARPARAS